MMLYLLMLPLCFGGCFCLMLSQTAHAKTLLGQPAKHPAALRAAGFALIAAALFAALASPHPAAAGTSWFGCLSAGAALCAVAAYFRGKKEVKDKKGTRSSETR